MDSRDKDRPRSAGAYSKIRPAAGRDSFFAGVPEQITGEETPAPVRVIVGTPENPIDTDTALRTLAKLFVEEKSASETTRSRVDSAAGEVKTSKWFMAGASIVTVVSAIFTAGVSMQVWLGANATDAEVAKAVQDVLIEHNGVDPDDRPVGSHGPVGHHPDLRAYMAAEQARIAALEAQQSAVAAGQRRMQCLAEFQLAFTQWQALVIDALRSRKPIPGRPQRVTDLETEILSGKCG